MLFSQTRNKRCLGTRQSHSRTNSSQPLNHYNLATRTPAQRPSYTNQKTNTRILQDPKQMRNIDLYQPLCQLDRQQFSSIINLITPDTLTVGPTQKISLDDLASSDFPVLKYKIKDLVQFSRSILQTSQFCRFNFTGKVVRRIVNLLADNYHSVAYHNFSHAFSLMLLNFQCLHRSFSLKYLYTEEQYFYIMVAGLAHDINHPGTNNIFQIKTKSALAGKYNNQSVLENMHISHLWKILRENPEFDFIAASKDKTKARNIVTRLILNTDMAFHNKNLDTLKTLNQNKQFLPKKNNDHKWMLMEQIFHACDIGNSCTQFDNYLSWTALLVCQFSEQAMQEEQRGLEVTKFLIFKGVDDIYKDQLFFVGNLVQPLWRQLGVICPDLTYIQKIIQQNLKKIKQKAENSIK